MRHYDDETLGAYIDGELDRETVKALEADSPERSGPAKTGHGTARHQHGAARVVR